MSHVTCINESCYTYKRITSYIWMSRCAYINESYCVCRCVVWYILVSHVTCMNESCYMNARITWYIWLSRVVYIDESWYLYRVAKTHRMPHLYRSFSAKEPCNQWLFCGKWPTSYGILWVFATLYEWVKLHLWTNYVVCMDESCRMYRWVLSCV